MSREELLKIWRTNLVNIEERIAEYGGESKAPLELTNLLRRAREEIASLESEATEEPLRSPSEQRLITSPDYVLVEIERLRRDVAAWQAGVLREIFEMTDEHIRPSERIIYDLKADTTQISQTIQQIKIDLAIMKRDLEGVKDEIEKFNLVTRDLERIKGVVGINGNHVLSARSMYIWAVITSIIVIAVGVFQVVLIARGL
jgi:hypothetical protein